MLKRNRRQFLKETGLGAASLAALGWPGGAQASHQKSVNRSSRPVFVSGVHAYTDRESYGGGQQINFFVSSTVPYNLSICRLGTDVDSPQSDQVLHCFPHARPYPQAICPGSFVHVDKGFKKVFPALTLECWVRPWGKNIRAGLITQYDYPNQCGFGLFLNAEGGVDFYVGNGRAFSGRWLMSAGSGQVKPGQWQHILAAWDGKEKTIWVNGDRVGQSRAELLGPGSDPGRAPLRLAAAGQAGWADSLLDGDLAMAVVYDARLNEQDVARRFAAKALDLPRGQHVRACWTFSEEHGERVKDIQNKYHGVIVNQATWMIGGPSFQANVARFGQYDPSRDQSRGHGLRFASDDLYDCQWECTEKFRLPPKARPGIYVGRVAYEFAGKPHWQHISFVVRKSARQKKASVVVLSATNTWRAYSATPFARPQSGLKRVAGTDGMSNSPGNPPAFSYYRKHAAGQGTYQIGLRMPWPVAGPYILYGGPTDYSHLMRADRFAQVWLEKAGYDYDVISDLDLHREPRLLEGYQTFIINGHSEYWSLPMYASLETYLKNGGNVVCLSGNSLFWRVSFNPEETIMECRKVDAPGDQVPSVRRGECWHSQDRLRGGLMRECGYPGWKLVGLETLGWINQSDAAQFGPYRVENSQHFLFNHPVRVPINNGDLIGHGAGRGLPMANGHEFDVRLSTLSALQQEPAPPDAALPADPEGMVRLANGIIPWKKGGSAFDYFMRPISPAIDQGGELIYWERPDGGRVFNAGSIGSGWALLSDPKLQLLLGNVLSHFGVEPGRNG